MPSVTALAERLRALRVDAGMTQESLAKALGVSVPLISSWEKATTPPVQRLDAYARLFAALRDDGPKLLGFDELTAAELRAYDALHAELLALRTPQPTGGPGARSPLKFGAGEAITIVCTKLPDARRARFGNEKRSDADYVDAYKYADLDALLELLPFVVALNPSSRVTVGTADELSTDDLTAHLIALGGVDWNPVTAALMRYFANVPVSQLKRDEDQDVGGFAVRMPSGDRRRMTPRVSREGERSSLLEDVAQFLRAPNPYNRQRTLTIFSGSFSRGSHGVVRALTDPKIHERNAAHVAQHLSRNDTYSVVCRVRIVADEVVVPDWTLADDRLYEWPEEAR
jgi:transcriptional regulator with XRE-family HTH domain